MILAEKIIKLRKQKGWSQEELALRIGVSRQSVSKWESMSSFPDLDKIIKLSELFGVSTDYLLKDDVEEEPGFELAGQEVQYHENAEDVKRTVTLEEANKYMQLVEKSAKKMAAAVAACILSPVFLIVSGGYAEAGIIPVSEDVIGGIGVAVLLVIIACAVMVFVYLGIQLGKYEYLEKEILDLQYGVAGIAEAKKEAHEGRYKIAIACGVAFCILSAVPLLVAAGFGLPDHVYTILVAVLLTFIACGVFLFVSEGMVRDCYEKLLEEGDYTVEKKLRSKRNDLVSTVYWCVVTALYLGYSFYTMSWKSSWVIWPVAGVLFAAVIGISDSVKRK